jgi:hypothetical protein
MYATKTSERAESDTISIAGDTYIRVNTEEQKELEEPVRVASLLPSPLRSVGTGRSVVPQRMKVKLPYVETQILASPSSANIVAGTRFHLNSIYDPNYSGTGHQPLGYDQWANFYQEYVVTGVDWTVTFSNMATGYTLMGCTIYHPDATLVGAQADTYLEQPGAQYRVLRHSDAGPASTWGGKFSTKKWFGADPMALDDIRGTFGSNPSDGVFLHVSVGTFATHASQSVAVITKLTYHVTLLKPLQLAGS